jgi:hypothetical protein
LGVTKLVDEPRGDDGGVATGKFAFATGYKVFEEKN